MNRPMTWKERKAESRRLMDVCIPKNSFYCIPLWCRMPGDAHLDGMGGCWGISSGLVSERGRDYCRTCTFYRRIAERVDCFSAMGDEMATEERNRGKPFAGFVPRAI